jgi:hypothetical protein
MGLRRPKLSYANVMVTLLAFVVLCGGGAYAAGQLGKGSVGTPQLRKNAVTSAKVKDGALKARDLAKGVLSAGPKGDAGPPGAQGPPGTSHGYEATGSVNYDKFSASLYGSTVVSLPVPPGPYFATASAEVETVNGIASTVSCRLIDGNGGSESSWAVSGSQPVRTDGNSDSLTLSGLFNVVQAKAINLQCSKSLEASSARVTEANIVAVSIGDATHLIE